MARRGAFDYILLETTGLADPGNIAPIFWVDDGLLSTIYLDGIVTLVDAKNLLASLDAPTPDTLVRPDDDDHDDHDDQDDQDDHDHDHDATHELTTAHLQISHADVIVLNKTDLVSAEELERVQARVRAINRLARIHLTDHSRLPQLEGLVLDLHAYDSVSAADLDFAAKGHSHLDPSISTIAIAIPPLTDPQLDRLDFWLRKVLWDSLLPPPLPEADAESPPTPPTPHRFEVHRTKGRICLLNGSIKLLQGVRDVFELTDPSPPPLQPPAPESQPTTDGKIVLIGRGLELQLFRSSLVKCLHLTP
jgi:G3E family GTPase